MNTGIGHSIGELLARGLRAERARAEHDKAPRKMRRAEQIAAAKLAREQRRATFR